MYSILIFLTLSSLIYCRTLYFFHRCTNYNLSFNITKYCNYYTMKLLYYSVISVIILLMTTIHSIRNYSKTFHFTNLFEMGSMENPMTLENYYFQMISNSFCNFSIEAWSLSLGRKLQNFWQNEKFQRNSFKLSPEVLFDIISYHWVA